MSHCSKWANAVCCDPGRGSWGRRGRGCSPPRAPWPAEKGHGGLSPICILRAGGGGGEGSSALSDSRRGLRIPGAGPARERAHGTRPAWRPKVNSSANDIILLIKGGLFGWARTRAGGGGAEGGKVHVAGVLMENMAPAAAGLMG